MSDALEPDGFAAYETWLGTPLPENPIEAMRILRHQAEQEIERLLAFLDATDGNPDLEDDGGGIGDQDGASEQLSGEPSLGWPEGLFGARALDLSEPGLDLDRELDEADAEPSLASPESVETPEHAPFDWQPLAGIRRSRVGAQTHWAKGNSSDLEGDAHEDDEESDTGIADEDAFHAENGEPSLGATEAVNQDSAWRPQQDGWHVQDGEPEFSSTRSEDALGNARPTRLGNLDGEDGGDTGPNGDEQDHTNAEDEF